MKSAHLALKMKVAPNILDIGDTVHVDENFYSLHSLVEVISKTNQQKSKTMENVNHIHALGEQMAKHAWRKYVTFIFSRNV